MTTTLHVKDILTGTLNLLDSPEAWIQKTSARDKEHRISSFNSPYATGWCLGAAICKVINSLPEVHPGARNEAYVSTCQTLFPDRESSYVITWNDARGRTYQEVRDKLVSTIERL